MVSGTFEQVEVEIDAQGIALVRLNNPAMRNAITPQLSKEMNQVLDQIHHDESVRVVVVTGAGEESFCAGMSLKHFIEYRSKVWELYSRGASMLDWWAKLRALPQPTIAAVNGYCVGGGFCVLDSCDLAIASERASFALSEVNFGSIPGGGAMRAALDMTSIKNAMYLILTGKPIDAQEAWRMGLVNKVVPHDRVLSEALELAQLLATHPWQTLEFCKKAAYGSKEIPSRALGIEYETAMSHFQMHARPPRAANAQEGLEAFVEKKYKPGVETYDFRKSKV
ncbi:MAG TPA: enoyl-CoA hydratase-related protein [Candidatus Bathyarchaeia archaeon]|nr:enoyl-CoA hydratase-related protein [Candidatus Bathyarchaeia archaeon]